MAMPMWPAELPELRGDPSGSTVDSFYPPNRVTQMDDGPPRVRRIAAWRAATHRVSMLLPEDGQLDVFKRFVVETLNNGVRRFVAPVWLADGSTAMRTCRITESPAVSFPDPTIPRVTFTLEVEDW